MAGTSKYSEKILDMMDKVDPVSQNDPPRKVIDLLKQNRVVILVDKDSRPISFLTDDDVDSVRNRFLQGARRAGDLFPAPSAERLNVVAEPEPIENLISEILKNGFTMGITVVDRRGRYLGYVFLTRLTRELRNLLKVKLERAELFAKFYPEIRDSLDRILSRLFRKDARNEGN